MTLHNFTIGILILTLLVQLYVIAGLIDLLRDFRGQPPIFRLPGMRR